MVGALVVSAFVVPYTWLTEVRAWYGSFLFWSLFALAVIIVVFFTTRKWVG